MSFVTCTPAAFRLLSRGCATAVLAVGVLASSLAIAGPAAAAPQRPGLPGARPEAIGQISAQAQAGAQARAGAQAQAGASARAVTRAGAQRRARQSAVAASAPAWLREINAYRRATGIAAVRVRAAWVTGISNHLRYMADTPARYMTGQYASLHTENPRSPYYTRIGAIQAAASDLFEGAAGFTAVQFIDGWLSSPFHAIGMLRPALRRVAFASNSTTGDAGLDVISGLTAARPDRQPVLFPGPGMTTNLLTYSGSEEPDPLQTCHWTARQARGLPLIALLPAPPARRLTATLTSAGTRESTARGTICLVDKHHYHSSDPIYGPTGAQILADDNAVLLIPAHPLRRGRYHVTIRQPALPDITWSFSVAAPR